MNDEVTFLHCSDLHLGRTWTGAPGADERYEDYFRAFAAVVDHALAAAVDAVIIAGDVFHEAQIRPRTLARTVAVLEPLRRAGIPAVAVEGNHDWIHRQEH